MNGEVRIWDVRAPDSPLVEMVAQQNGLCALAVHDCAPVFATLVRARRTLTLSVRRPRLLIKRGNASSSMALTPQSPSSCRQWTSLCRQPSTLPAVSGRLVRARHP